MFYYKCLKCGKTISSDDTNFIAGDTSYFWGVPATETEEVCPFCGSPDLVFDDSDDAEERCERPYTYADYCEDNYDPLYDKIANCCDS